MGISVHPSIYLVSKSLENPQLNRMAQRHGCEGFRGLQNKTKHCELLLKGPDLWQKLLCDPGMGQNLPGGHEWHERHEGPAIPSIFDGKPG